MQGGGSSGSISIRKKHRPSHPASSVSGRQPPVSDALQGLPAVGASHHADVLKERAMDDLKGYFERKGVSRSRAEDFKIHIKQKGTGDGSYSVHYTDKSGEMYMSKGDVFVSLDRPARKQPQSQVSASPVCPRRATLYPPPRYPSHWGACTRFLHVHCIASIYLNPLACCIPDEHNARQQRAAQLCARDAKEDRPRGAPTAGQGGQGG